MMPGIMCALVAPVFAGLSAFGGQKPDMATQPESPPISSYTAPARKSFRLENGLRVVWVEDHRFPLLTVRLAVRAGGALTERKNAGMLDALAELLTEGTRSRSAKEIAEAVDAFGGALAADASRDHVVISAFSLAEKAHDMLKLLADISLSPTFPEPEVVLRKNNMLEELKLSRSQPDFLAGVIFNRSLYGGHPYGTVSPTEGSIQRISRESLVRLHRRLFVPTEAVLVVVGDVEEEVLKRRLREAFGTWKAREDAVDARTFGIQRKDGGERRVVLFDRAGSAQAALRIGNLAVTERDPDYYALMVGNMVLGGSFASRLMTDLRERKGYTYSVYSDLDAHLAAGSFEVLTQVRTEVTRPALEALLEQMRGIRGAEVSAQELEQAKTLLVGRFVRRLETQEGVGNAVLHGLLHELPLDCLDSYVRKVREVTADHILSAAKKHILEKSAVIAVVGDAAQLGKALEGFSQTPVRLVDYNGD